MSRFELNVYGDNDEVLKTFTTDFIRWGVFLQAVEIHEQTEGKEPNEQFALIGELIKKLFPGITDADLSMADSQDVINIFWMLVCKANRIGGNSKKK